MKILNSAFLSCISNSPHQKSIHKISPNVNADSFDNKSLWFNRVYFYNLKNQVHNVEYQFLLTQLVSVPTLF